MQGRSTRQLKSADGTSLCADVYPAQSHAQPKESDVRRGIVVILHGYCEHKGRYTHVAEHLTAHGYDVLVGDLRGHGESGGARGFVERFGDYLDDVSAFVAAANSEFGRTSARKPVLLGHSMGGLVALHYVLANPEVFRALVLSSPFLGLKIDVPGWKRYLGLAASVLYPGLKLPNGLDSKDISHDSAVCERYMSDPLVTHMATARWFTEITSAQLDLRARAGQVRIPTVMLHAGDDRIVDAKASQAVFDRIGASDKNLTFYPGLFHEIFNETAADRERVLTDLTNWLADR
jgi:lysophospholipase